jgi:hypothetical protein
MARLAALYASFGVRTSEAFVRMLAGETLIADGRRAEGEAELQRALEFFRSVSAPLFVARCEAALAGAQSASA